eukprot:TRINITY_DN21492_c0_g1_i2.p1 TRINITY_DN21492_c0_g1~~TRINITY_DN21492_c0_g1_i2.p1  ORF type:complete len:336 (+),score=85.02 TRINITY_DN21492_c0_g1_i2:184-1191(+)
MCIRDRYQRRVRGSPLCHTMPWTGAVKKTIYEIFDHMDTDCDSVITVEDMLRCMKDTVSEAGIRDAFRSLDKTAAGRIARPDWKAQWKTRCQDPKHPDTQDLIKMRRQFGLNELLGDPGQELSEMYRLTVSKQKARAQKNKEASLNLESGWTQSVVDALTRLHKKIHARGWAAVAGSVEVSQLAFPEPFAECAEAGGLMMLPEWLDSFERHYRISRSLTTEKVLLLAEQLGFSSQFASSPTSGTICVLNESPIFVPETNYTQDTEATAAMELTVDRVTAAAAKTQASEAEEVAPEDGAPFAPATIEAPAAVAETEGIVAPERTRSDSNKSNNARA